MKRIARVLLWVFLALVIVFFLLPMFGPNLFSILGAVSLGWLRFLNRVIPLASVSWSGFGMVVVCSALIIAGMHHLAGWFCQQRASRTGSEGVPWRWQWSICVYTLLWLLFLAAIGITGFVHQVGWLLASKEPWSVSRKHRWSLVADLKQAAMEVLVAGEDNEWEISATQKDFFESDRLGFRRGAVLQEEVQVLFIPDTSNRLARAALFYRDPEKRERAGIIVVSNDKENGLQERPFADLPKVLMWPQR